MSAARNIARYFCGLCSQEIVHEAPAKDPKTGVPVHAECLKKKCPEGGIHIYSADLEYDSTGETVNCEKCGEPEPLKPRRAHKRSRPSYRFAISWVAENDSAGDSDALDPEEVQHLITAALVADIFDVPQEKVGKDIVRYRKKLRGSQ